MLPQVNDPNERRGAPRKLLRVAATVEIEGRSAMTVRTVEVSSTGVGLSCPINLPLGTRCRVSFAIPLAGNRIEVQGQQATVMNSVLSQHDGGFRLGCQFSGLPPALAARLQAYVKGGG